MNAIAAEEHLKSCELELQRRADGTLVVGLKGSWCIGANLPSDAEVNTALAGQPAVQDLKFDAERLSGWDRGLVTFLVQVPQHSILSGGFDRATQQKLVHGNWLRTIAWSARGLLVLWMIGQVILQLSGVSDLGQPSGAGV